MEWNLEKATYSDSHLCPELYSVDETEQIQMLKSKKHNLW